MTIAEHHTVATPQAYAHAYISGEPVSIPEGSNLMGRIIRGRQPEDFEWLAADGRPLVFTMASDGLEKLPGRPLRQALADIALNPEYVEGRIRQGYSYRLAVFEADTQHGLATWQNVLHTVVSVVPELEEDVAKHAKELESKPFSFYQDQLPEDIDQIELDGEQNPLYLTLDRYFAMSPQERFASSEPLRRLLANAFHFGPRFGGEGYTVEEDGSRGLREYVIPNARIETLKNAVALPIKH